MTHSRNLLLRHGQLMPFFLLCFLLCMEALAAPRGPRQPLNEDRVLCVYPSDELSGEVTLDSGCYYEQAFEIDEADTHLDCAGAELRGLSDTYILNIKRGADRARVSDCYLRGGKGIAVRARRRREGESDDELRALAPVDVQLERLQISDSENVGLHLHTHTVGVTLRDSILTNHSSAGVYISPYGRNHQLINNRIEGNGHRKPDGSARIGWYRREGIAVDAASEHQIIGNEIIGNAFGGILLYKNCWEHAAEDPRSQPRREHARGNLIRENLFADQPFGVWVAARQSRDLQLMGCGDPTPYEGSIFVDMLFHPTYRDFPSAYYEGYVFSLFRVSVWPDFAEENQIIGNRFERISRGGIRIEDDDTVIRENLFIGDFDYIFVGAPFRARLDGHPVMRTEIAQNSYHSPSGADFEARLALIPDEHEETALIENERACLSENIVWVRAGSESQAESEDGACVTTHRCRDGQWQTSRAGDCEQEVEDLGAALEADRAMGEGADAGHADARRTDVGQGDVDRGDTLQSENERERGDQSVDAQMSSLDLGAGSPSPSRRGCAAGRGGALAPAHALVFLFCLLQITRRPEAGVP
ncbi:MAG: right-handed parallel beta-helix repeat-containing protein [Myxococcota bacterium]|nr:right-handed parallel beta-helix repeat-containing protein [Myxococcota bacterium]